MFTRQQYLSRECNHNAYYAQFVTQSLKSELKKMWLDRIVDSKKEYFNDIPLVLWDRLMGGRGQIYSKQMRDLGDHPTLAGLVCIGKEAARQIKEENNALAR